MELNLDDDRLVDVPVGDATITARIVPIDELNGMRRKCTRLRNGREDFDQDKFSRLFWDATIKEWEGITVGGMSFECNADNKWQLVNKYQEIMSAITEAVEDAKAATLEAEKALIKN